MKSIYLDHNATTPLDPVVAEEMARVVRDLAGNPASQHQSGRQARRELENARDAIGQLLGLGAGDRLVFTSGGTESNNWVLRGLLTAGHTLITSSIEHPSIAETAKGLIHEGVRVRTLPVNSDGVTELSDLADWLGDGAQLVSVMLGNNETGVLQPVPDIVRQCRAAGVPVHTDAVQAIGKIGVSFRELGVSAMTIAAHKFHGPVGIGALVSAANLHLRPLLFGGFQQAALRPGTESVVLAVGMQKALEQWDREAAERHERMRALRDRFEEIICAAIPFARVIGSAAPRLPHTSNISFVGCDRQAIVMALDLRKVFCSTGSACASGSSEPSPVLLAMNLPADVVNGAVRFSVGASTTIADIEEAARRVIASLKQIPQPAASRMR